MKKVTVPASTSNMGSGFDVMGIALGLYNSVQYEESDDIIVETDGVKVPVGPKNLIVRTVMDVMRTCGKPFRGLHTIQQNHIPMTRGLGSSSACIVAGVLIGNELAGNPLSRDDMVDFASKLEGHPDNAAPSLLGGFVVSAIEGEKVYYVRHPMDDSLRFAAFIPDFAMRTDESRKLLPESYAKADVVHSIARSSLFAASLMAGRHGNFAVALDDRMHQPFRLPLVAGAEGIFAAARELGAYGTYLSGAGPTIISIIDRENTGFSEGAKAYLAAHHPGYQLFILQADNEGAKID